MIAFLACTAMWIGMPSSEVFDAAEEAKMLNNIRQVTFAEMGFEKAGEAYFSPDDSTIIFQAVPTGQEQYQIYSLKLDEGVARLVSTGKGACTCAYFRPDGQKVIFASSHEDPDLDNPDYEQDVPGYKRQGGTYSWAFTPYMNVYEANPDGTDLKALTSGPSYHAECAYSHDGSRIVYASNESGTMNLYTMNSDGTNVVAVTTTDYSYNGGPFFSPDDSQIIFRSDRQLEDMLQIYAINTDGSNERQLTDNGAVNWAPYWHPNGKVIAFTTSLHGHAHYEIYLMNIETGKTHRLTHNSTFDGLPVFSNDGTKLMWTSKRGLSASQIFIADFTMPEELLRR
ncbi:MAG: PD40 domain-containing protein [Verrucomicrobia bacterium]|nr:PD40 domain-containing protein [Verrucomicrobiota bacterium]MBS0637652.1 PD40 domain-containing protein [Verrucomicrobiota bacterium]